MSASASRVRHAVERLLLPFSLAACARGSADEGVVFPEAWNEASRGSPSRRPGASEVAGAHADSDVGRPMTPLEQELARGCGGPNVSLATAARDLAEATLRGAGSAKIDLVAVQRAAGDPHVGARAIVATGRRGTVRAAFAARVAEERRSGRTCGVGSAEDPPTEVLTAIVADATAELSPLPRRAIVGSWHTLDARLLVPASAARVYLAGPHGGPRSVPTAFDAASGTVRAQFALNARGAFTVQVVAELGSGPKPVLETRMVAGPTATDTAATPERAPGEVAGGGLQDAAALERMIHGAREHEGLDALTHDGALERVAHAHAARMRDRRLVAHVLDDVDPRARVEGEGLSAERIDENVARAASVELAHRALYASPSHRQNMLRPDGGRVGVGVARGDDGYYVCELFATAR